MLRILVVFLMFNKDVFSEYDSCLSVPLGIVYQGDKVIASAKAEILVTEHEAEDTAELEAKSLLKLEKDDSISGVYKIDSCVVNNAVYVSIARDKFSRKISQSIKVLIENSISKHPTPR